jgi:hypothetical protein
MEKNKCEVCWTKGTQDNEIADTHLGYQLCQKCIEKVKEKILEKTGQELEIDKKFKKVNGYKHLTGKRGGKLTRFINIKKSKDKFYRLLNLTKEEKLALQLYRKIYLLWLSHITTYIE